MTNKTNTPAAPRNLLNLKALAEKAGHDTQLKRPEYGYGPWTLLVEDLRNCTRFRVYECFDDIAQDIERGFGSMVHYQHTLNRATWKTRTNRESARKWEEAVGFDCFAGTAFNTNVWSGVIGA